MMSLRDIVERVLIVAAMSERMSECGCGVVVDLRRETTTHSRG
jgi:hypothetical protein